MGEKTEELLMKYALQNAVFYGGKADAKAVVGKALAAESSLRKDPAKVMEKVRDIVDKVNAMKEKDQQEALKKADPSMLKREEKKQEELPDIQGAVPGKFVTRFAPSPTGPLNIGHLLRPVLLPYLYAKRYKGQFIVRIEDTDPKKIARENYDYIIEDLMQAGVKWDKLVKESDHMDLYYQHAEQLGTTGKAYVCDCPAEKFRKLKLEKKDCPCRDLLPGEQAGRWKKMFSGYREGEAVLRLKTGMKLPNPAFRDPPLMRIAEGNHPLKGKEYRVWPLYNFACAVEDHFLMVTHVFRGKEHEHNTGIQKFIYDSFGWKAPHVINFGMVYLPGTKLHTRDMKEMIARREASGWDDPKLPTVRSLLRRGFQREAFKKFALTCGMSKNDIRVGWENLEGINRKIIDQVSHRYMLAIDPVITSLEGAPGAGFVEHYFHPDFPARGKRKMPIDPRRVYVSGKDFEVFEGNQIRLIDLGNVKLGGKSSYLGDKLGGAMPKIQWVSYPNVPVKVLMPDGSKAKGVGEIGLTVLKPGTLIQMERIGFGRIDSVGKEVVIAYAHK